MIKALVLSVLGLTVFVLAARGQTCPKVCVTFPQIAPEACDEVPRRDTTAARQVWSESYSYREVHDIASGHIRLETHGNGIFGGTTSNISLSDDFRLTGPPAGTAVTFTATLVAAGAGGSYTYDPEGFGWNSSATVGLRTSPSNQQQVVFDGTVASPSTLSLAITAEPDAPFTLTLFGSTDIWFWESGSGTFADGLLTFIDLPTGARVFSCGGYALDPATPTVRRTWGSLKARFR